MEDDKPVFLHTGGMQADQSPVTDHQLDKQNYCSIRQHDMWLSMQFKIAVICWYVAYFGQRR